MTSKHHRWQERWDLNQDPGLAVHDSGLRVRLEDGVGVADNAGEVEHTLAQQHGVHNAPPMVRRLIREGAQMLIDPAARGWRG